MPAYLLDGSLPPVERLIEPFISVSPPAPILDLRETSRDYYFSVDLPLVTVEAVAKILLQQPGIIGAVPACYVLGIMKLPSSSWRSLEPQLFELLEGALRTIFGASTPIQRYWCELNTYFASPPYCPGMGESFDRLYYPYTTPREA